jgi:hypothetical protein
MTTIREITQAITDAIATLPLSEAKVLQHKLQQRIDQLLDEEQRDPRSAFLEDDASRRLASDHRQGRNEFRTDNDHTLSPRSWFLRQSELQQRGDR